MTHLQSVSLTGVCSHLISAHTLCLSLPPWGDGMPSARAVHTHAPARACADTLFVAQRLQSWLLDSAYLSAERGQHDTDSHPLTFHQLQYRESLSRRYRSLKSWPEVLPRCVCVWVCRCGFNPRQTPRRHFEAWEVTWTKAEKETDLKKR